MLVPRDDAADDHQGHPPPPPPSPSRRPSGGTSGVVQQIQGGPFMLPDLPEIRSGRLTAYSCSRSHGPLRRTPGCGGNMTDLLEPAPEDAIYKPPSPALGRRRDARAPSGNRVQSSSTRRWRTATCRVECLHLHHETYRAFKSCTSAPRSAGLSESRRTMSSPEFGYANVQLLRKGIGEERQFGRARGILFALGATETLALAMARTAPNRGSSQRGAGRRMPNRREMGRRSRSRSAPGP